MIRRILTLALLALPAAAQLTPPQAVHDDPRIVRTVTPSYEVWANGTIAQTFSLGVDVTAARFADMPDAPLEAVRVELRGFPAGSAWDDYRVRVDCSWISAYIWVYGDNAGQSSIPAATASSTLWPRVMIGDLLPWTEGGYGYPIYGVSFGLGSQHLKPLATWDGAVDWSGPGGDWKGQANNINPSADNQPEGDYYPVRSLLAASQGGVVPCYFAPLQITTWTGAVTHGCTWTLPDPAHIGAGPKPIEGSHGCDGHAAQWPYGDRLDARGTGGPYGGGMTYTVRYVPASILPAGHVPSPRVLFALAMRASADDPELRRMVLAHADAIVSVDRDAVSGAPVVGFRAE